MSDFLIRIFTISLNDQNSIDSLHEIIITINLV